MVHKNHQHTPFTPHIIQQFHGEMYKFAPVRASKGKITDNTIEELSKNGERIVRFQPVTAYLTPQASENLHREFEHAVKKMKGGSIEQKLNEYKNCYSGIPSHMDADKASHITVKTAFDLAKRTKEIDESSKVEEKR